MFMWPYHTIGIDIDSPCSPDLTTTQMRESKLPFSHLKPNRSTLSRSPGRLQKR